MKFLDLFAGIGGFRLGMEMAGHECVGHCEIDKFAEKSYRAMHDVKEGEWYAADIRTVRACDIPRTDVWCFGFPCQDISVAGNRAGFKGNRSSLFFTVTGLLKSINEESRPKYLFIENVKNLLSVNRGYDFARLLVEMDEIGYDAEWEVLNSKDFGVPQNRERVFIIGHLRGQSTGETATENTIKQIVGGRRFKMDGEPMFTLTRQDRHVVLIKEATKKGYAEATEGDSINLSMPNSKTRRGRVGKGVANTLDTSCNQGVIEGYRIRKLTPRECFRLQGFPDEYFVRAAAVNSDNQLYKQAGNSVTVNVVYEIAKRLEEEQ